MGMDQDPQWGFAMLWALEIKIAYCDHLVDFQDNPNHIRGATPY
jgi:hypothetical protein